MSGCVRVVEPGKGQEAGKEECCKLGGLEQVAVCTGLQEPASEWRQGKVMGRRRDREGRETE